MAKMGNQIFTREEIEQWLGDLGKEAESRQYTVAYKLGFQMAFVAVMSKMDDARRKPAGARQLQEDLAGRN
jgi:hypothetical protein